MHQQIFNEGLFRVFLKLKFFLKDYLLNAGSFDDVSETLLLESIHCNLRMISKSEIKKPYTFFISSNSFVYFRFMFVLSYLIRLNVPWNEFFGSIRIEFNLGYLFMMTVLYMPVEAFPDEKRERAKGAGVLLSSQVPDNALIKRYLKKQDVCGFWLLWARNQN